MRLARPLLTLLVLAPLAGCSMLDDENETALGPVEGGLVIAVRDSLYTSQGPSPVPTLVLNTEKIYPCMNFALAHRTARDGSTVRVDVRGVQSEDMCMTAIGPATARVPLDLAPGAYTLRLALGGQTDTYRLRVDAGTATLTPETTVFSRIGDTRP